ncbi:hypothetical protein EC912_10373 [Luteibacter rhizovicinus]|uniref:Uncharacterized protein n=1 Tax=Luteibacter rhizovicinus TaxID=242606 RepID=A0A4V2W455_9GAMM|nr:hypothetical protein [Luteibacter rhizovicinus]TCV94589.1 hypothetical protein EC912_10373 [Luteibacter rhizovicinus]
MIHDLATVSSLLPLKIPNPTKTEPANKETSVIDTGYVREVRSDAGASVHAYLNDMTHTSSVFADFAERFTKHLEHIDSLRQGVIDKTFDVVVENGSLRVVDSRLDSESTAWLERELNTDPELASLAKAFNAQVVKVYDTGSGSRDAEGKQLEHGTFPMEGGGEIDYAGLASTIDASVKFVSLLRDVSSANRAADSMRGIDPDSHEPEYFDAGLIVQRYLQGTITSYEKRADGSLVTRTGVSHSRMRMFT